MKVERDDQQELLEDIFTPDAGNLSLSSAEVVRLVEGARRARGRAHRRIAAAVTAVVMAIGFGAWFSTRIPMEKRDELADSALPRGTPEAPAAKAEVGIAKTEAGITPPKMERVDDEGMLAMLKDQPTALVRWPDGRQTLLLLTR